MNKQTVIAMLLKCANELDNIGQEDDADALSNLASDLVGAPVKSPKYQDDFQDALSALPEMGMDSNQSMLSDAQDAHMEMPQHDLRHYRHDDPKRFIDDLQQAGAHIQ